MKRFTESQRFRFHIRSRTLHQTFGGYERTRSDMDGVGILSSREFREEF